MQHHHLLALTDRGFHRLHYVERGDPANPRVLVCAHGLTRNARDFDALADRFAAGWRVVCIDMPGRGASDWLPNPALYNFATYLQCASVLLARLDVERVTWLGTSMGGIIGMLLAAQALTPIAALVLNDVGPFIPKAAIERLGEYVSRAPEFTDLADAEAYLRSIHAPFGNVSDHQWQQMAIHSTRKLADGRLALHYDPAIATAFRAAAATDIDLWTVWDAVRCPVLAIRGHHSDLFLAETAAAMHQRGPRADTVEIADAGHAPLLASDPEIRIVQQWLDQRPAAAA